MRGFESYSLSLQGKGLLLLGFVFKLSENRRRLLVWAKTLQMHQKIYIRHNFQLQIHNFYYLPAFFCADVIFCDQLNWNQNVR